MKESNFNKHFAQFTAKVLTVEEYLQFFYTYDQNYPHSYGFEYDAENWDTYFCAVVFLPKTFFSFLNKFSNIPTSKLPEYIRVKFELCSIEGMEADGKEVMGFIFRPWVMNIKNNKILQLLESFSLFIPNSIFFNLIELLVFSNLLQYDQFSEIRVLEQIPNIYPHFTFQKFGINQHSPKLINTKYGNVLIERINDGWSKNTTFLNEISSFYSQNFNFDPELQKFYCDETISIWFKIKTETMLVDNTIGFIRLYKQDNFFGMCLEYVVAKEYRRKGVASTAVSSLIEYLKKYSHISELHAETQNSNRISSKILITLGFKLRYQTLTHSGFALNILEDVI